MTARTPDAAPWPGLHVALAAPAAELLRRSLLAHLPGRWSWVPRSWGGMEVAVAPEALPRASALAARRGVVLRQLPVADHMAPGLFADGLAPPCWPDLCATGSARALAHDPARAGTELAAVWRALLPDAQQRASGQRWHLAWLGGGGVDDRAPLPPAPPPVPEWERHAVRLQGWAAGGGRRPEHLWAVAARCAHLQVVRLAGPGAGSLRGECDDLRRELRRC